MVVQRLLERPNDMRVQADDASCNVHQVLAADRLCAEPEEVQRPHRVGC